MNCNECGTPMTKIDPREITDPQPTRYVDRWRCDEPECPAQGEAVEGESNGITLDGVRREWRKKIERMRDERDWEWQNKDFDRDIVVDAHLEIIKLRAKIAAAEKIFALCGGLSELAKWENGQGKPQKKLIDEYLKLL